MDHGLVLLITGDQHRRPLLRCLRRLGANAVEIVTPADLSCPGWVHDPHDPGGDTVVVDGSRRRVGDVDGVVTALDDVRPFDLPHVHPADQVFVAQEMTAFLRSWCAGLECPVVDRPTPMALSGRAADPSVWSTAAAATGMADLRWGFSPSGPRRRIAVVDGSAVGGSKHDPGGSGADVLARSAEQLATAAGVTAVLLTLAEGAESAALVRVDPWWNRPTDATLAAVLMALSRSNTDTAALAGNSPPTHRTSPAAVR